MGYFFEVFSNRDKNNYEYSELYDRVIWLDLADNLEKAADIVAKYDGPTTSKVQMHSLWIWNVQ